MPYRNIVLAVCVLFIVYPMSSFPFSKEINSTEDTLAFSTRAHWMRVTNQVLLDLVSPCPFSAFATAIVNHTLPGLGELVCIGVNQISNTGNPTMHGEMVAIANCSDILTAKNGNYGLSPDEALSALSQLSLYTNGESCPMCASAIRWAGFKEYIYGTSINTLIKAGWGQIRIDSRDVFEASVYLQSKTKLISDVLSNETDPFFMWQYNPSYPCPPGCKRTDTGCEAF